MFDLDSIRKTIVTGLKDTLSIPVICSNQTGNLPPYPYLSYTITSPILDNKGTWGEYADGKNRKPFTQVWSITVQSDNISESLLYALKAYEWFDRAGDVYFSDNDIVVCNVENMGNRDNMVSIAYEYRNGFDVTFRLMAEIDNPNDKTGYIETATISRK